MEKIDVFIILFIAFAIYCAINLKKDYIEYKNSDHYLEYNIFIRNLGVVVAGVVLFFYGLTRLF